MSMNGDKAEVEIFGKRYMLTGEGMDQLKVAAALVDDRLKKTSQILKNKPREDLAVLVALNLASEMLELERETKRTENFIEDTSSDLIQLIEDGTGSRIRDSKPLDNGGG